MTVLTLLRRLEDALVGDLDVRPIQVSLPAARGSWKGAPVEIAARAYAGGAFRFCRFIELSGGGLQIGNALCLPRLDVPLPIFGADLVAPGHGSVMIAADLSPVTADATAPAIAPHGLPPGGELPEWCRRSFSPQALYTRLPEARLEQAAGPLLAFARALASMRIPPEPSRTANITAAHLGYCASHVEDDKGLGMLARMFGADWSARFVREVMFPLPA